MRHMAVVTTMTRFYYNKDKLILCSYYLSAINQLADVFDAYEQNELQISFQIHLSWYRIVDSLT